MNDVPEITLIGFEQTVGRTFDGSRLTKRLQQASDERGFTRAQITLQKYA
jgi:hypothetical protein